MLTINIYSFSYLYTGMPEDISGNGGGFVFDCRFIYNPGRESDFMPLTGKDEKIIKFLDANNEMQSFLNNCYLIIDSAIDKYLDRNFTDLMVSFGCTGGRHRSVYAAEHLNKHLTLKYKDKLKTQLTHSNIN